MTTPHSNKPEQETPAQDTTQQDSPAETEITVADMIKSGETIIKQAKHHVDTTAIDGKTIKEWTAFFKVDIPAEVDVPQYYELCSQVDRLQQIAHYYLTRAEKSGATIASLRERQYTAAVSNIIEKNKLPRTPAAATLATMAEDKVSIATSAKSEAQSNARFWKRMVDSLSMTHSTLKSLGYLLGEEARMTHK